MYPYKLRINEALKKRGSFSGHLEIEMCMLKVTLKLWKEGVWGHDIKVLSEIDYMC